MKYGGDDVKLCRSDDDLCLEGYPCSANTFSYVLLKQLNRELSVGHHTHSIANIKIALKHGVPAVVLIRNPKDAISSRIVRFNREIDECVLEYIAFYGYVLKNLAKITVLPFEEVVHDTERSIDHIVKSTGIDLPCEDLEAVKQKVFVRIKDWTDRHRDRSNISLPVKEREAKKAKLEQRILQSRYFDRAEAIYLDILGQRNEHKG